MVYCILHQLLEQSKFEEILHLFQTDPSSHQLTEEEYNSNLPLHLSLQVQAPKEVILQILYLNEDATKWKGNDSNLPLHIATQRNISPEIIERLIRVHPKSLDARNADGVTPREIGHSDSSALQALLRPTCCWLNLLKDEEREEQQDSRLVLLHNSVQSALDSMETSERTMEDLLTRIDKMDKELQHFGEDRFHHIEKKLSTMETSIIEKFDKTENVLCMVEDDIQALETMEYMSKMSCEASSTQIRKIQKNSTHMAESLCKDVRAFKYKLV